MLDGWRRTLRGVLFAAGLAAGIWLGALLGRVTYEARLMLLGARRRVHRTPADLDLAASDVVLRGEDGVTVRGWFIAATSADRAPAVLIVHGWPWHRGGNRAGELTLPDADVDLLAPAAALQRRGLHVLLIDLRNHGTSDAAPPVTFGLRESRDVLAAVSWLAQQPGVDAQRIGVLGYSMGANAALYAAAAGEQIHAVVAVQPVEPAVFLQRYGREQYGAIGVALARIASMLPRMLGGPVLGQIRLLPLVRQIRHTRVRYIQGDRDPWGEHQAVVELERATPHTAGLITVAAGDRYAGYQYPTHHPEVIGELLGR